MPRAQPIREDAKPPSREPFRTLRGWAIGGVLGTHAIRECEEHGHMRDRTDPDACARDRFEAPLSRRHAGSASTRPGGARAIRYRRRPPAAGRWSSESKAMRGQCSNGVSLL
jgi:hypothetical protein